MISINDFANLIMKVADKNLSIKNIKGPEGVRGRCSDNAVISKDLNWKPAYNLEQGISITYNWVAKQVEQLMAKD